MKARKSETVRTTNECEVSVSLNLDGSGNSDVYTSIGFLDHLLIALTRHARFDLKLSCRGDLEVDDHHSAEDCGLALGTALCEALGERRGIARFGWALAPLDEALARAAVDLSGRPYAAIDLGLCRESIGGLCSENVGHFLGSFATAGRLCLHVDLLKGQNDHHRAEAAFKALALAVGQAVARISGAAADQVPSTKGVL